jgi:hypothetical protein
VLELWILLLLLLKIAGFNSNQFPPHVSFFVLQKDWVLWYFTFMQLHSHFLAILASSIFSAMLPIMGVVCIAQSASIYNKFSCHLSFQNFLIVYFYC